MPKSPPARRIVARREHHAADRAVFPDHAGGRGVESRPPRRPGCARSRCGCDLQRRLHHLAVEEAAVAADHQGGAGRSGRQSTIAWDEVLDVTRLAEDRHLLAQARVPGFWSGKGCVATALTVMGSRPGSGLRGGRPLQPGLCRLPPAGGQPGRPVSHRAAQVFGRLGLRPSRAPARLRPHPRRRGGRPVVRWRNPSIGPGRPNRLACARGRPRRPGRRARRWSRRPPPGPAGPGPGRGRARSARSSPPARSNRRAGEGGIDP